MDENNAQSETRGTRSEKVSGSQGASDTRWEEGARVSGSNNGSFSGRIAGAIRPGADSACLSLITGGILSQLVLDARERLGKTRECIEWYQREESEELKRLENLEKLQQLADRQLNAEVPADHIGEA